MRSESYIKKQEKAKINEENARLYYRLAGMKSDVMNMLHIKRHQKLFEESK